jgi:nitroreductase
MMPMELFVPHVDVGLVAGHAALMASALGLSITYLSWASRTKEHELALRQLLTIPDHYEVVVGAACGYPLRVAVKPQRKPVRTTLVYR